MWKSSTTIRLLIQYTRYILFPNRLFMYECGLGSCSDLVQQDDTDF